MSLRRCRGSFCPNLVPAGVRDGRCDGCRRTADRARGSRADRGYGAEHVRAAKSWRAKVDAGELVLCWRCEQPILTGADLHLGHDDADRSITRGPEHQLCNLSAAGRAAH